MELLNTHSETRIWPAIMTADGPTLELGPGESAEVAVPEDKEAQARFFEAISNDPWLAAADDEAAAALDAAREAREVAAREAADEEPASTVGGRGRGRNPQGRTGRAGSGPENGPDTTSGGDGPPDESTKTPDEANASGKEA